MPVASAFVGPSPAGPAILRLVDPDLELRLPPGWTVLTLVELRAQAEMGKANSPERFGDLYDEMIREIDDGELRAGGSGPAGYDPWQSTLLVEVTPARSLDALIDRNAREQRPIVEPKATVRTTATTPIGDAVRVMVTSDPPADVVGVAARAITFYVDLGDGRILWITATAPEASTTFEALMDQLVAGVRRR